MPGSVAKLADRLQEIGINANVEVGPVESVPLGLHLFYLSLCNSFVHMNQSITAFIHRSIRLKSAQPSATVPTGTQSTIAKPRKAKVPQQKANQPSPSTTLNVGHQNIASGSISNVAAQNQQPLTNPDHDYMILCSDESGWLTSREDVNVSNIKSDKELFGVFRNRVHRRHSRTHRFASLKTIQQISFVEVSDKRGFKKRNQRLMRDSSPSVEIMKSISLNAT
jgi:hypothetical protein